MRIPRSRRALALVTLAVLAAGCGVAPRPDLARLYRSWAAREANRRPVIVIHGLLGSRLVDRETGELVWGGVRGLLGGDTGTRLALPIEPGASSPLEARGFVETVAGVDVYGGIMAILEEQGGYLRAERQRPPYRRATCFPFFYDWRLDNAVNAARLAARIAEIRELYHDPHLTVDIVAHSMGGLIARYFVLYGGRDVLDDPDPSPDMAGAGAVARLVMLGTPNLGSAEALAACIEGDRVGLTRMPPEALATMPSMYELMPAPDLPALYESDGRPAAIDIYELETWRDLGWGPFDPAHRAGMASRFHAAHPAADGAAFAAYGARMAEHFGRQLDRARAFHRALAAAPLPESVDTYLLGGDCTPTPRAFLVERDGGRPRVRLALADVRSAPAGVDLWALYLAPGDGTVTKQSLLGAIPSGRGGVARTGLPHARAVFICEEHRRLVGNLTFQDNLLHILLYEPQTTAEACTLP